jgi:prepilin-type N-terminal cleavage/methylation domain-containing protein
MNRRGFTFVELLVVMIVMGILASIAVLRYRDLTNEAIVGRIGADMQTVRLAALNHYADTNQWPAEHAEGTVPNEMVRYLPTNWSFSQPTHSYDWDNLGGVVGITIRSGRAGVIEKLRQRFVRGAPYIDLGGNVMFLIVGPGVGI